MEAERSIILQKKMILFLSLLIGVVFGAIYGREINFKNDKLYVNEIDNSKLVTVNMSEAENEILRENVKYLATKVIVEEKDLYKVNNESVEVFAGDVSNLAYSKLEETSVILENEIVAENNESVNEEIAENTETIIIDAVSETVADVPENTENVSVSIEPVQNIEVEEVLKPKTVRYRDLAENNPPTEYQSVIEVSATAYCLCKKCCGKSEDHPYYGYTHSGIKIEKGTGIKVIAVDPNIIPLKSKVYVEGLYGAWDYGHAIAADTGSAIKELKIDLYMDTHEEALEWGRRKVKVYVLGE